MKKALFSVFVLVLVFLVSASVVNAQASTTPPVVSIGTGNGNAPDNVGPTHGSFYNGNISVFATVDDVDSDLESYHFRVIKDGGAEGHTCTGPNALFLPQNQNYASTTLLSDACGFVFNQSIYTTSNFINTNIATINTFDLSAFSGEGAYWFIIGARDVTGSRMHADYLLDPRVKITVDHTAPVTISGISGRINTDPITVFGTTTDSNGVDSVSFFSANYDGTNCGVFSPITALSGASSTSFEWTNAWTPVSSGVYCVSISGKDVAVNTEVETVVGNGIIFDLPVPPTPTPVPSPAPVSSPTPAPAGGGNGPIVGSFGGGNSGQVLGQSISREDLLGEKASDLSCTPHLNTYLGRGKKNNSEDVKKLQNFLNEYLGLNIEVNGVFGPATLEAVKDFQLKESAEILLPWFKAGFMKSDKEPTGYVYKTTVRRINMLKCSGADIPMPQLP